MRRVQAWVTEDGVVHLDHQRARAHAGRRYGDLLCRLSHQLVAIEKYAAMSDWLEANSRGFLDLERLRMDQFVEGDEEEDGETEDGA